MTLARSSEPLPDGFDVSAFDLLFQADPQLILVGGQAVNLWANVFLTDFPQLECLKPFLSRDCDVYGNRRLVNTLARITGWKPTLTPVGQASPVVGFLTSKDASGRELLVEVLFSLKGLSDQELEKQAVVELNGKTYRTLSPITLLKAKLANYVGLPQRSETLERNDIKHLRILVWCVAGYLAQAHERVKCGDFTERSLVNLLEETFKLVTGPEALKAHKTEDIGFSHCFPKVIRTSSLPKIRNFVEHRLRPQQ